MFNHNGSDKSKFEAACEKYGLAIFDATWLNSATLVRRTWSQFSDSGYGVKDMCDFLGIYLKPHNAAADALATAEIISIASKLTEYSVEDWEIELESPSYGGNTSSSSSRNKKTYDDYQSRIHGDVTEPPDLEKVTNKDNPFYGEKVVISGKYKTWQDRMELAKLLKNLGADIDTGIGKHTNILCAGDGVGWKKKEIMQKRIDNGEEVLILNEEEILEILTNKDGSVNPTIPPGTLW